MRSLTALKMLLHDRSTTIGSVIGVVAIVFLVGQQISVLFGLFTYMSALVDHSGADIWICSENTQNVNATGSIPERYIERIKGLQGIDWAEPIVIGSGSFKRRDGQYQGVQVVGLKAPRMTGGPWKFYKGSINDLFDYDGITVDNLDLGILGNPQLNSVYEISNKKVRINAITKNVRGFAGSLVFTNIEKAKEILKFTPGRCSAILVKLKPGIALKQSIDKLKSVLPNSEVISSAELSNKTRIYYIANTGMGGSFGFSTFIGALVGIVIIMLTMYTGVLNRQKEFAILRAIGARRRDILIIVFSQSVLIGIAGIFIGFIFLSFFLVSTQDSRLPSYFPRWFPFIHAAFTILLCLIGSVLAMYRAIKIEPASAFR